MQERDDKCFMSMLLDPLFSALVGDKKQTILDYGAGIGTMPRLFHELGHDVIAYEPMPEMFAALQKATPASRYPNIRAYGDLSFDDAHFKIDTLVCVNVFDHLLDVPKVLRDFHRYLKDDGRLILSIPHPIKNLGAWVKETREGQWAYLYYRLDDYLKEGQVKRNREDVNGNLIIKDVISQHRTISTYFNWIVEAGFRVNRMTEPKPTEDDVKKFPVLCAQCARIPYFWILDCAKN